MYSPSNMGEMNQNGQQQVGMYDPNQQHVQHPIGQNQGKSVQIMLRKRSEEKGEKREGKRKENYRKETKLN